MRDVFRRVPADVLTASRRRGGRGAKGHASWTHGPVGVPINRIGQNVGCDANLLPRQTVHPPKSGFMRIARRVEQLHAHRRRRKPPDHLHRRRAHTALARASRRSARRSWPVRGLPGRDRAGRDGRPPRSRAPPRPGQAVYPALAGASWGRTARRATPYRLASGTRPRSAARPTRATRSRARTSNHAVTCTVVAHKTAPATASRPFSVPVLSRAERAQARQTRTSTSAASARALSCSSSASTACTPRPRNKAGMVEAPVRLVQRRPQAREDKAARGGKPRHA